MVNYERKLVKSSVGTLYLEDVKVIDLIAELSDWVKKHGDNIIVDYVNNNWDDCRTLQVFKLMLEEDYAYNERIKKEEERFAVIEERERREFERLSKKFKDGV